MSEPGRSGKGIAAYPVPDDESPDSNIGVKDDSATDSEDAAASEAPTTVDLLSALEDSQRGLSSHYAGKAKSFWNLADMSVEDLSKKEHPVNKRRRLRIALEREIKGAGDSSANDQKNQGDQN